MKKKKYKKAGVAFLLSFLFTFMLFIFGPSEIFFANESEFDFIYGDFAGYFTAAAVLGAFLMALVLSFLPDKLYRGLLSVIFGLSVAGYLQVMFLNKDLDLLGVNPEGYQASPGRAAGNLIIWSVIILAIVILSILKTSMWEKMTQYLAAFLLCIQVVALISLLLTAKEEAYKYTTEKVWHLSGEQQYVVSADKNVIVLVLDYFSNQYLAPLQTEYPGATDFLHDFTYYSNMDCTYFGTFPSLPHMLTGVELDMTLPVNEWCEQIWENERTTGFYNALKDQGFVANVYTQNAKILCGLNGTELLEGKVDNVVYSVQEVDVWNKVLLQTMAKMSFYRMFPDLIKPYFYANIDKYSRVVLPKDNIVHENYDFYQGLKQKGLSLDNDSNYFIVQHLQGTHLFTTDELGYNKENATLEETAKGCMVVVEEYIDQLKQLGVYDDAAIIITADHGRSSDSQVIFFVKEPGDKHEVSPVTNAPVSFNEFLPTIAEAAGLDYYEYGESIHDFSENEQRERTNWIRNKDSNYPTVPCYTGDKDGSSNVYYGYTYVGEYEDFLKSVEEGPDAIIKMVDSYF